MAVGEDCRHGRRCPCGQCQLRRRLDLLLVAVQEDRWKSARLRALQMFENFKALTWPDLYDRLVRSGLGLSLEALKEYLDMTTLGRDDIPTSSHA